MNFIKAILWGLVATAIIAFLFEILKRIPWLTIENLKFWQGWITGWIVCRVVYYHLQSKSITDDEKPSRKGRFIN